MNKTLIKLKVISGINESKDGKTRTDQYVSEHYKVTLTIRYIKTSGEETWINNGTITVEGKNGNKVAQSYYGECGC